MVGMDTSQARSLDVVVATDGSTDADLAVDWAAQEATVRAAALLIVSASPAGSTPGESYRVACDIVETARDRVRRRFPTLVIKTSVVEGDPREALAACQRWASVVVLGSRGRNALRTVWLGSVSYWATRHLDVPTAVIRPLAGAPASFDHGVAVGLDQDDSETALRLAFDVAARRGCPLTIVHAWWDADASGARWSPVEAEAVDPQRRQRIDELVEPVAAEYPTVSFAVVYGRGDVVELLLSMCRNHGVLVIGRKRAAPFDSLGLGTVATAIVEHAHGVTMVVPSAKRAPKGDHHERDEFVTAAQERIRVGDSVGEDRGAQLAYACASPWLEHPVDGAFTAPTAPTAPRPSRPPGLAIRGSEA